MLSLGGNISHNDRKLYVYGFSAGGSYSKSKVNSNYASVKTQAGIYAGDEGYDIHIKEHTELTGGLVTSTDKAETEGKNRFSTGTLNATDIENTSSSSADGFSLSGSATVSGGEAPKEVGGVKLKEIGENHKDGSSKVELGGVAGVANQGNWGITKGLVTGLLGQVHSRSNESGITTSAINTRNLVIRDENAQTQLGTSSAEMIAKVNKDNIHQSVNQVDGSQLQSEIENDLAISKSFVNNINNTGDEIYYRMEKNEDSIFSIQKTRPDCNHIDCLAFDKDGKNLADNSQELKAILYSDKVLTEEQAELFSRIGTAGMLNLVPKEKVASAILYGDDLASIDETPTILNRGSAGIVNEFIFTGFERLRAWANMPAIFGASNATREHAQIAKKLDEYNAHAKLNGNKEVPLFNVAHSLGVSGNKNMLNWSEYMNQSYNNTKVTYWHLGGSYPSAEIDQQAKGLFKEVDTQYHGVKGDTVYSGVLGYFIGNNPNATQVEGLSFGKAHSDANQNINNLKYIYNDRDEKSYKKWNDTQKIIRDVTVDGIRKFNTVEGD